MKISVGNDHKGCKLALHLIKYLQKKNIEILYYGTFSEHGSVDYPDYAKLIANDVATGKSKFGILICKTGTGMCITANKIKNVRAANCMSEEIARLSRAHNNANILCLGAAFIGNKKSQIITDVFLQTDFEGDRHLNRLNKISEIE